MPEIAEKKLPFRIYTGKDILLRDETKSQPLIQGILFENDYIMIAAKKKSYKSILTMQMACNLSSGTKLLDTFKVPKPQMVWYFATEGKDEDIKDRFIRMSQYVKINTENILLICSPGFRFNSRFGTEYIKYLCEKYKDKLPKVIIIDALYMALKGSIKDDEDVNDFTTQVRVFAEHCNAAVIIVHHTKKSTIYEGRVVDLGDEEVYGSAFLLASVDHCFLMEKLPGDDKRAVLRCDTQRSGNIVEEIEI
jgi:RecA-family ATPase